MSLCIKYMYFDVFAIDHIFDQQPDIKIFRSDLNQLFSYAFVQTHFIFNNDFWDQINGVAMGSPLAPILANLLMGFHEEKCINEYSGTGPILYRRYYFLST